MGKSLTPNECHAIGNLLIHQHHVPREKVRFYHYWGKEQMVYLPPPSSGGEDTAGAEDG